MTQQTQQEINRIREALIPAATDLLSAAELIPSSQDFSGQTREDIGKIRSYAVEFRQDAENCFPKNPDFPDGKVPVDFLKQSRHDCRNSLNHLFNLVQLLSIAEEFKKIGTSLEKVSAVLEQCLKILTVSSSETSSADPVPPPAAKPLKSLSHPGVILIADDNEENRNLLARLLEPAGHTLHFAKDGVEAIEQIGKTVFDAVLLDIQMPKMDGFEVLASLRESGHLGQTPVIVVTGLQEEQDAVRCIEIGAEDFLSRPIRPALLMARLNASLEKKRLREQVFEQYFTPELARELARNPDPMKMAARHADVSLLFCDVREFSAISERLGPSQTVDWLRGIMGEFSSRVIDFGGVLVDYTGDELLAMWGAPSHQPDHADLACKAALAIMDSLDELNKKWQPIVEAETKVGVGINTGEALVGNIGTHRKFKYGPLGTTVNLASRVQGATKFLKTPLLITGNTVAQLSEEFKTRRLCKVRVQNIHEPVDLYELVENDIGDEWVERAKRYEKALCLFEENKLVDSSAILGNVLVETRNDGPCLQLMSRVVEAMLSDLPVDEFCPIWDLPGK
ncbi:MAG: response regulator [Verrucomicrobiales bacterium]|nr:response regulator [Verrucomicrobiales bacterium]